MSASSRQRTPPITVVVPAHNEAAVIRRSLEELVRDAEPGELDVIVVCNGCSDNTADIVRALGAPIRVIETDTPSKANALNLGEAAAQGFPRVYMDADVVMSTASLRRLVGVLGGGVLAAAPEVNTVFKPDADWSVRAYYDFWMALPFVQEGMMAAGTYAVSEEGRRRFGAFPEIISDDGYFRLQFTSAERVEVRGAMSTVTAPSRWADLVRIKTRSRLGVYQLRERYPDLFADELRSKRRLGALLTMAARPRLYLAALPFAAISLISRARAQRQRTSQASYVWERDHSSRA